MDLEDYIDYMTKKDGWKKRLNEEVMKAKVVAFYFSAAWCPPCRGFTPILSKFYDAVNET
jgi:thiol-disulfide isomerase/thioredoxin